ncbi:transposase [Selenihalanaerobacter shriftii]|uniref:Transposase n=1 Tax=Selenihalanaerobacter shriftii TaxID=142842 RepID=A0A1T4R200_9FIRM|nr:transposase [Selenihalanaerobacter shriftii]
MPKRYNDEFKKQIVSLVNNGKKPSEVVKEYNIARSTVHKWVKIIRIQVHLKPKTTELIKKKN